MHSKAFVKNYYLDVFGIKYPHNTLYPRDLKTQMPPQIYPHIWEQLFQPGDTVLDIGAYVGIISIHLAFMGGIVHAFEGSPRNIPRLAEACKPLRQITMHKIALSNINKTCVTQFNDCIDREHPIQEITYCTYDKYAQNIPVPKFIKMDIEGMESVALLGMKQLLEHRISWQIEYHKNLHISYEDYPGFLTPEKGGFDFNEFTNMEYTIFDKSLHIIEADDMETFQNYFIIPNEITNTLEKVSEEPETLHIGNLRSYLQ